MGKKIGTYCRCAECGHVFKLSKFTKHVIEKEGIERLSCPACKGKLLSFSDDYKILYERRFV